MARRGYPPEFRRRVVDLVEGGRKVSDVDERSPAVGRWRGLTEIGPVRAMACRVPRACATGGPGVLEAPEPAEGGSSMCLHPRGPALAGMRHQSRRPPDHRRPLPSRIVGDNSRDASFEP